MTLHNYIDMIKVTKIRIYILALFGVLFMLSSSCKKKDNTPSHLTITDIDGNVYHTVTIGTQLWMVENLKTTKFNDNTAIPMVTDSTAWMNLITPGVCWYNNDAGAYKNTCGALYNSFAVNTGKLAPIGWHIPTDAEWTILTTYLGGDSIAGGKLKETGTTHWQSPNTGATNETGFTAIPGGYRTSNGSFSRINYFGYWWSVSEAVTGYVWSRGIYNNYNNVFRGNVSKNDGFSVRCLRD